MWKSETLMGLAIATFAIFVMVFAGLLVSFIIQASVLGYVVGFLSFLATGMFLMLGGCLFARQPLDDNAKYNDDGSPTPSWQRAIFGLRLIIASIFLFLYGLLLSFISLFLGI
ncbi:MAG: hypothetical protein EAX95_07225 [Candidatus Thorarchaeota archaeon]|nr:hypothetical protein [Candidatus Thorarchaeota archaeon]